MTRDFILFRNRPICRHIFLCTQIGGAIARLPPEYLSPADREVRGRVGGLAGILLRLGFAVLDEGDVVAVGGPALAVARGRVDLVAGTAFDADWIIAGDRAHGARDRRIGLDLQVARDARAAHGAGHVPVVARRVLLRHHRDGDGAPRGARVHARAVVRATAVALLGAVHDAVTALRRLADVARADAAGAVGSGETRLSVGAIRAGPAAIDVGLRSVLHAVGAGGDGDACTLWEIARAARAVEVGGAGLLSGAPGAVGAAAVHVGLITIL